MLLTSCAFRSNLEAGQKPEMFRQNMLMFLKCIKDAVTAPHQFHAFHEAIRKPFDFYRWYAPLPIPLQCALTL